MRRGRIGAGAVVVLIGLAAACSSTGDAGRGFQPAPTSTAAPERRTPTAIDMCLSAVPVAGDPPAVAVDGLVEASGVVASRHVPGVFWTHNDSPETLAVHAFDEDGIDLGTWSVSGEVFDLEDIAYGSGHLYLADLGDNFQQRSSIVVTRFPEPDPESGGGAVDPAETASVRLQYPDGAHDAETLLVDPMTGELIIVTKERIDGGVPVYTAAVDFDAQPSEPVALAAAESMELGDVDSVPTGGDVSSDGSLIAIRTYTDVAIFERLPGESLAQALVSPPCEAASAFEAQGEAIAFTLDARGYVTTSEGSEPPLNRFTVD